MLTRERPNQGREQPRQGPPQGGPGDGNLDGLRQAGEELWAAGDDAINRALSGNSEAFLAATRQEGGQ